MKVHYRYPAVAKAVHGNSSRSRHTLFVCEGDADIPEMEDREAPVVAEVHREEGSSKYRWLDGRLHAVIGRADFFERSGEAASVFRNSGIEDRMRRLATNELSAARELPHPTTDARKYLDRVQIVGEKRAARFAKASAAIPGVPTLKSLDPKWHDAEALDMWTRYAESAASELFVCGETVWAPVPEPCLFVWMRRTSGEMQHCDADFYKQRTELAGMPQHALFKTRYWTGSPNTAFALTDYAEAVEFKERCMPAGEGTEDVVVAVEVFDEEPFKFDFHRAELVRSADKAVVAARYFARLNPAVGDPWRMLAEALEAEDMDAVCDHADKLREALDQRELTLRGDSRSSVAIIDQLSLGIERWRDRPITSTLSLGGGPRP